MVWILRRLVWPLLIGTIACAALLIILILTTADVPQSIRLEDVWETTLLIIPFEAAGLFLLMPIALVVCKQSFSPLLTVAAVILIGAAIAVALALPLSNAPLHQDLALPVVFGAVSAGIWLWINRDGMNR